MFDGSRRLPSLGRNNNKAGCNTRLPVLPDGMVIHLHYSCTTQTAILLRRIIIVRVVGYFAVPINHYCYYRSYYIIDCLAHACRARAAADVFFFFFTKKYSNFKAARAIALQCSQCFSLLVSYFVCTRGTRKYHVRPVRVQVYRAIRVSRDERRRYL